MLLWIELSRKNIYELISKQRSISPCLHVTLSLYGFGSVSRLSGFFSRFFTVITFQIFKFARPEYHWRDICQNKSALIRCIKIDMVWIIQIVGLGNKCSTYVIILNKITSIKNILIPPPFRPNPEGRLSNFIFGIPFQPCKCNFTCSHSQRLLMISVLFLLGKYELKFSYYRKEKRGEMCIKISFVHSFVAHTNCK
jgi:hypothetical protein